MATNVELKHSAVASKGFVQAVQRLSECRKDCMALEEIIGE